MTKAYEFAKAVRDNGLDYRTVLFQYATELGGERSHGLSGEVVIFDDGSSVLIRGAHSGRPEVLERT
jgi:hypothetical protein